MSVNLQMLRVTHDLKAPFSGIENNIQILKHLYWNETPECVRQIIAKIDARSMSLRARIGDILTLGSLRSEEAAGQSAAVAQYQAMARRTLDEIAPVARELGGEFVRLEPVSVLKPHTHGMTPELHHRKRPARNLMITRLVRVTFVGQPECLIDQ